MAEGFVRHGVTWFEEPVSPTISRARLLRTARPPGWISPPANTATTCATSCACSRRRGGRAAGGRYALPGDHRLLQAARACRSFGPVLAPTAPVAAPPPLLRAARGHLEYFHDHARIEGMLFDGAGAAGRRAEAGPLAPGDGDHLRASDAARFEV